MTVLGKEELIEHEVAELSKEIQILGRHLKESGCRRVVIYLPNNVEYLLTIFGGFIRAIWKDLADKG
jgi:acyl-CoA synthetase (AMP-forming)/AMP-acid ligase II